MGTEMFKDVCCEYFTKSWYTEISMDIHIWTTKDRTEVSWSDESWFPQWHSVSTTQAAADEMLGEILSQHIVDLLVQIEQHFATTAYWLYPHLCETTVDPSSDALLQWSDMPCHKASILNTYWTLTEVTATRSQSIRDGLLCDGMADWHQATWQTPTSFASQSRLYGPKSLRNLSNRL